jgi:hypothetical protein
VARIRPALASLVDEITSKGGKAIAVPTDVADPESVYALAEAAESHFGRIDTWANNAAVAVWGRIEDISHQESDRVMRVNFLGQVHGVHAAFGAASSRGRRRHRRSLRRRGSGGPDACALPRQQVGTAQLLRLPAHGAERVERRHRRLCHAARPIATRFFETHEARSVPCRSHHRRRTPPKLSPARSSGPHAAKPTREVPVGGAAVGFFLGKRLSPALTDAVMPLRPDAVDAQRSDRPDNGTDNVDRPVDEPGRVRGNFTGAVVECSGFTTLLGHPRRPTELLAQLRSRTYRR